MAEARWAGAGRIGAGLACMAACCGVCVLPQVASAEGRAMELQKQWMIRSSALVDAPAEEVSRPGFQAEGWYPTSVPSTVLNALVKNGVYPDPRIGLNNFLIPDASDEFNAKHDLAKYSHLPGKRNPWAAPYWYRTEFPLPGASAGRRIWLDFDAINYRADIWLNGKPVADRRQVVGSFSRYRFDVTKQASPGRVNCLAVKVYPVDHPGVPDAQFDVFGKVRDFRKEIMKDVTLVMSIGYDCMPTVRDRLTGLWQGVRVEGSGPVVVRNPFVVTDLPLPKTSPARLTVSAELTNATDTPQKGVLTGRIVETGATFSMPVELAPNQTRSVTCSPEQHPALVIADPRLWWPVNCGPQHLYRMVLRFELDGNTSDEKTVAFGIRQITKRLHELDGAHGLQLHVNGQKIFCRGGYIQPEMLYDWEPERMEAEIRYLTHANLNIVFFEDVPNPPDAFLDLCDHYGLMFGNCFYGCYWMQPKTNYPEDLDLLSQGTIDILKRYRNHPSLVLYMAQNEGEPREPVYEMWRRHVLDLDPTRIFIPSGSFPDYRKNVPEWIKKDLPTGTNDYAPKSYGWQPPEQYFKWVRHERNWMFMLESGSASLPPIASLSRFIPDLEAAPESSPYPLNKTWAEHGANSYYKPYDQALRRLLGEPSSVADYCRKGHLLTADQHRAMFEAVNHRMWDVTSGFCQWKLNSCWPSVQWQLYDWYLRPMVSLYYIRKACAPLHVQLCPLDSMVSVVNNRFDRAGGLDVHARVYGLDMKLKWDKREKVDVPANAYKDVFAVPTISDVGPIRFVKLDLRDAAGAVVADNFYWLSTKVPPDLKDLAKLPPVKLEASHTVENKGAERIATVRLENPTDKLAFFIHLALTKGADGEEILPVFWDDDYFSLLPGETRTVRAAFVAKDAGDKPPALKIDGWNIVSK